MHYPTRGSLFTDYYCVCWFPGVILTTLACEAMVKAGTIPFVVHEPPAGIRLLPSAPVYQQQRQRQQEQHQRHLQQQQQQRQMVAQPTFGQSYRAKAGGLGSPPALIAASSGVGGVVNGGGNHHHHQQQPSYSQPPSLTSPRAALGKGPQVGGLDENVVTGTSDDRITFGWTNDEPPASASASSPSPSEWPRPGSAAGDRKDDDTAPAAEAPGNSNGWGEEDQGDGEHELRFGSFGVVDSHDSVTAAPDSGGTTGGPAASASAGRPSSSRTAVAQKREVNWKELNRNLNLLLKEDGGMSGRDLNHCFQQRFGKVIRLNGGAAVRSWPPEQYWS